MFKFRAARNSPYREIQDVTYLEDLEPKLLDEYENSERVPYELKEKLFYLYLRMWELEPEKEFYQNSITRFVLEIGWDMKRQKVNYQQAEMFFEDLIKCVRPRSIPIAHYRLGFIHYYNKKYRSSIRHFESALRKPDHSMPERQPLSHEKLNESQSMKAQAQLAVALTRYSVEAAMKARQMYEELGNPDDYDIDYVMKLEQEILKEESKPYVILTPAGRHLLTHQEYRDLRQDETAFIFDCTDHDEKRVIIKGKPVHIAHRRMQILEILFKKQKPVPQKEIADTLNIQQVSRYMNELKRDLTHCGLDELTIVADNGYRINHPKPILIRNENDPKYVM